MDRIKTIKNLLSPLNNPGKFLVLQRFSRFYVDRQVFKAGIVINYKCFSASCKCLSHFTYDDIYFSSSDTKGCNNRSIFTH